MRVRRGKLVLAPSLYLDRRPVTSQNGGGGGGAGGVRTGARWPDQLCQAMMESRGDEPRKEAALHVHHERDQWPAGPGAFLLREGSAASRQPGRPLSPRAFPAGVPRLGFLGLTHASPDGTVRHRVAAPGLIRRGCPRDASRSLQHSGARGTARGGARWGKPMRRHRLARGSTCTGNRSCTRPTRRRSGRS
jgi:hypothetical protein